MSQETLQAINELQPIATRLREREEQINHGKKNLFEKISDLTELAYEQGRDLILAKTKVGKHLRFSEWLHIHVPQLPLDQANKYERVATEQLSDPRQCIFAFLPAPEPTESQERSKPRYWEVGWGHATRLVALAKTNPLNTWPEAQRNGLRNELQPIAEALWPEKFGA